jgi:F-type H+-transporting ATPase subunit alpha
VNKGYYEGVPVKKALEFEQAFLDDVRVNNSDLLAQIDSSGELTGAQEQVLVAAMESFKVGFSYN